MRENDDILNLLKEKESESVWRTQRGVIIQPGAIGDCVLTLPLAEFMKDCLGLGGVDILGHTEYVGILPGRTCVDSVRSMDSADLHRLFAEPKAFCLPDRDALINAFADYMWIVTFLGEPGSNFEKNLIFTVNCSHSAEVITLLLKPPEDFSGHLTDFYIKQFIDQSGLSLERRKAGVTNRLIKATEADVKRGKELLKEINVLSAKKPVVIQPGSGGMNKCCHLDNFLAAAKKLISKGAEVIFLLGPAEMERFAPAVLLRKIEAAGAKCLTDLSLTDVVGLLSCADKFIGNDSGITHLAAALGVKTIAVFGPTNPEVYKPVGAKVTVITSNTAVFATEPSEKLQKELLGTLAAVN